MAFFSTVILVVLIPHTTLLDLRQGVPIELPASLDAGDFLILEIKDSQNIFMDGEVASSFPESRSFAAPAAKSHGFYTNIYYRKNFGDRIVWWNRSIPVRQSAIEVIRLPASIPHIDSDETYSEILTEISKKSNGVLRSPCFARPLNTVVVSNFGEPRVLPNGKTYRHNGVDQRAWIGSPVKVVSNGYVLYLGEQPVAGQMIIVDHGAGITSRYMHLSKFNTKTDFTVRKGQTIGFSGNSGRSTGPHLHWELSWKGAPLNPLRFLQKMEPICDPG